MANPNSLQWIKDTKAIDPRVGLQAKRPNFGNLYLQLRHQLPKVDKAEAGNLEFQVRRIVTLLEAKCPQAQARILHKNSNSCFFWTGVRRKEMATAIAIVQTMIDMALTAQERAEFQQEVLNLGRLIIKLQGRFEAYE
ncbi:MAG: hypothetical protein LQ338_003822, partial [Usnochroma carphineum]